VARFDKASLLARIENRESCGEGTKEEHKALKELQKALDI